MSTNEDIMDFLKGLSKKLEGLEVKVDATNNRLEVVEVKVDATNNRLEAKVGETNKIVADLYEEFKAFRRDTTERVLRDNYRKQFGESFAH